MNALLAVVVVLLAVGALWGYHKGLLMMVYSLAAWIAALLVVSCATPFITSAVISGTTVDEQIEERTAVWLRSYVRGGASQASGEAGLEGERPASGHEADPEGERPAFGLGVPGLLGELWAGMEELPDKALEQMGIYDQIARSISERLIQGAVFLIVLFLTRLVLMLAGYALNIISRLRGIREVNKLGGAAAGCAEALLIVWLVLAAVAFGSASPWGQGALAYVYDSGLLRFLYENNLIVALAGRLW